jgi:hypothetical protein
MVHKNTEKAAGNSFDESFKIEMKRYFEKFAEVITDYEIIDLPKSVDLLVIKTIISIDKYVKVFKYFKTYNIIEFKSAADTFRMWEDVNKILVYIGGFLLREKKASASNTTFSLVCSRKSIKLLKDGIASVKVIDKGIYRLDGICYLPVYLIVISELRFDLEKDVAVLKEFSMGKDLDDYLRNLLRGYRIGYKKYIDYLKHTIILYKNEIKEILKEENINMTLFEKNLNSWNKELGLTEKYYQQGMEKGMKKGMKKGIEKGIEKGMEKGMEKGQQELAKKLIKLGVDPKKIMKATRSSISKKVKT